MAFFDLAWYINFGDGSTTGYYAVTRRPQNTAVAAGVVRRQFTAPAQGSERCFVCIVGGTTANTTDATWTITRGAKTTDGTATWQECTGAAAVNGDTTNTPAWTVVASTAVTLGQIIKRVNGASYWICSTAGTPGSSEPAWANNTAGTTRTDGTATWTCLGVVGNFSAWSAPSPRLVTILGGSGFSLAGNTVFVADNHNETYSGDPNLGGGTLVAPIYVYSVDHSAAVPPGTGNLLAGATITATTNLNGITIAGAGIYYYGITFAEDASLTGVQWLWVGAASVQSWQVFDNCKFNLGTSNAATSYIEIGPTASSSAYVEWRNCTYKSTNAQNLLLPANVMFVWRGGGLDAAATSPTVLLAGYGSDTQAVVWLEGLDLSICSGTIHGRRGSVLAATQAELQDCKLHASATIAATPFAPGGNNTDAIRCDSVGTNYQLARYRYQGTETTETSITRIGGATDGTTSQARKIVTTANAKWILPFEATPLATWNESTSTTTVTVYGTWNSGSVPNNDDIWIEAEYLSSASHTLGAFAHNTKANNLATGSALNSDASSWNGGGSGGGWSPFKLAATIAPLQKGPISVYVKAARASATFYIDPQVTLS